MAVSASSGAALLLYGTGGVAFDSQERSGQVVPVRSRPCRARPPLRNTNEHRLGGRWRHRGHGHRELAGPGRISPLPFGGGTTHSALRARSCAARAVCRNWKLHLGRHDLRRGARRPELQVLIIRHSPGRTGPGFLPGPFRLRQHRRTAAPRRFRPPWRARRWRPAPAECEPRPSGDPPAPPSRRRTRPSCRAGPGRPCPAA